jgi:hypothetical protein
MWTFLEGFAAALVVVAVCVALFPIVWLLCGGPLWPR